MLEKCPFDWNGQAFYRENWATRDTASGTDPSKACTPCGEGVLGRFRDTDEVPDENIMVSDPLYPGLVASTRWSCCKCPDLMHLSMAASQAHKPFVVVCVCVFWFAAFQHDCLCECLICCA